MTARKSRRIPAFRTEEQEREFWASHDSSESVEWNKAQRARLANLRPSTRTISIRLPETMIERLKVLANKRGVPYQSLLKLYVAEKIEEELRPEEWDRAMPNDSPDCVKSRAGGDLSLTVCAD